MLTTEAQYEVIDHTADIGYVCRGRSLSELFENCGVSFADMVFGPRCESVLERDIEVSAASADELLVRFLNELLFLWESSAFVLHEVNVSEITATHLCGTVGGETYDPDKHEAPTEVKAATYHELRVEETADGWTARVIFDV